MVDPTQLGSSGPQGGSPLHSNPQVKNNQNLGQAFYQNIALEPNDEQPVGISIEPVREDIEIPKEYEELQKAIFRDAKILTDVVRPPRNDQTIILREYLRIANIAFHPTNPKLRYATIKLEEARAELVKVTNRTRIRKFTMQLMISGVLILFCGGLLSYNYSKIANFIFSTPSTENINITLAACFSVIGVGASLLFLAFVRYNYVTYETLLKNNVHDYWTARQIGYISVITSIIFFSVAVDLIIVGVAGVPLNDIDKKPILGIAIGFIGGVFPAFYVAFIEKLIPKGK